MYDMVGPRSFLFFPPPFTALPFPDNLRLEQKKIKSLVLSSVTLPPHHCLSVRGALRLRPHSRVCPGGGGGGPPGGGGPSPPTPLAAAFLLTLCQELLQ